jgi:hypothetical protein
LINGTGYSVRTAGCLALNEDTVRSGFDDAAFRIPKDYFVEFVAGTVFLKQPVMVRSTAICLAISNIAPTLLIGKKT